MYRIHNYIYTYIYYTIYFHYVLSYRLYVDRYKIKDKSDLSINLLKIFSNNYKLYF